MPDFKVVIPARLGSTRLPRKVLLPIHGRPLVQFAWQAAHAAGASEVVIATDSNEVADAARAFGAGVAMTDAAHASGTDRINEVAQARGWSPDTLVVNLQGDEPLMPPALVRQAASLLATDAQADIATLAAHLSDPHEWRNPNCVKVVLDQAGCALYFSRAPIPWQRDGASAGQPVMPHGRALRHIGLYAYRVAALRRFSALPPADLEQIEALEQLRALAHGLRIRVGIAATVPGRGVDTAEDLAAVAALIPPP